jgi:hypothetical protein
MTKAKDDEVRKLFTEIGCIMEDASLVALVWGDDDKLNTHARYRTVIDAHAKISELLAQIDGVI